MPLPAARIKACFTLILFCNIFKKTGQKFVHKRKKVKEGMVTSANVLIDIEGGKDKEALSAVSKTDVLKSANAVTGPSDIICFPFLISFKLWENL